MSPKIVFAYITFGSAAEARRAGRVLVKEKLAACVNIIGGMTSVYSWKGKLEESNETILIAKTEKRLFKKLSFRVRELHSYKVPCILQIPVPEGNPEYLRWLKQGLKR